MSNGFSVKRQFHVQVGRHGRKSLRDKSTEQAPLTGGIPRVARLMALAIRFDELIRDGTVTDQAELARLGHVSRARLTQIMNLLTLAPDIQEELLLQAPTHRGRKHLSERQLRPIAALASWPRQRRKWSALGRRGLVCPAEGD